MVVFRSDVSWWCSGLMCHGGVQGGVMMVLDVEGWSDDGVGRRRVE